MTPSPSQGLLSRALFSYYGKPFRAPAEAGTAGPFNEPDVVSQRRFGDIMQSVFDK
jgi:hypothetical protein